MEDILQVKREMWIAIADFPNVLLVVFLAGMCSSILTTYTRTDLCLEAGNISLGWIWSCTIELQLKSQLWTESKFWLVGQLLVESALPEPTIPYQVINWLSSAVHLLIWHLGFHLFDDDISKSLNLERKPFYLKQNHKGESRDRIHKFANSICQSTKLVFNFLYLHQKLPRNSQLNQILKNNLYQNKF